MFPPEETMTFIKLLKLCFCLHNIFFVLSIQELDVLRT